MVMVDLGSLVPLSSLLKSLFYRLLVLDKLSISSSVVELYVVVKEFFGHNSSTIFATENLKFPFV